MSKSSVELLASKKTVAIEGSSQSCVGVYEGRYGHVFFKNGEYAEIVYEDSYLNDDEDVSLSVCITSAIMI